PSIVWSRSLTSVPLGSVRTSLMRWLVPNGRFHSHRCVDSEWSETRSTSAFGVRPWKPERPTSQSGTGLSQLGDEVILGGSIIDHRVPAEQFSQACETCGIREELVSVPVA